MSIWGNTLVDDHNRYAILQKHPEICFSAMPLRFANREEALAWICKNQLGRRNLSPEQKRYLLGKQYEAEKKAAKIFRGNQYTLAKKSGGDHGDTHHSGKKTCDRIAEENGVSRASVLRARHYTKGIDIADTLSPGIKKKVFSGEVKFTNDEMSKLVQSSPDKRQDVFAEIMHPEDRSAPQKRIYGINYSALEAAVRRIQQDVDFLMKYLLKVPDDAYVKMESMKILRQHKAYMAQFEEMLNDEKVA